MFKKIKLAPYVLKRYEEKSDIFFLYNLRDEKFWKTDAVMGSIINFFNGSYTQKSIVDMLISENPSLPKLQLEKYLADTVEFLSKEGFLCEQV